MEERAAAGHRDAEIATASTGTPPALTPPIDQTVIHDLYTAKCAAAEKALPRVLPSVWEYCQKHRAAGRSWPACPWDRSIGLYPFKLLELWHLLHIEKPRTILELGTGCTTAVFLAYGAERFVTVDENAVYQAFVLQDLPQCKSMILPKSSASGNRNCFYYGIREQQAARNVDFLYVDGPSNHLGGNNFQVCTDACALADFPPRTILFDIRRESVTYTKEFYGDRYRWDDSCWGETCIPWYLSAVRHHSVARRRV